jgi:hypothetical protein
MGIIDPPKSPLYPAHAGSSTPRLVGSITDVSGILDRPVKPDDDDVRVRRLTTELQTCFHASRRKAPELYFETFAL